MVEVSGRPGDDTRECIHNHEATGEIKFVCEIAFVCIDVQSYLTLSLKMFKKSPREIFMMMDK